MKQNLNHQNDVPLHLAIYTVWCILSAAVIVGPAFIIENVNSVMWHFWTRTLFLLCKEWTVISIKYFFFNKMKWYHTSSSVMDVVNTHFHDQVILNHCCGWFVVGWYWPPYCISPCDCICGAITVTLKVLQLYKWNVFDRLVPMCAQQCKGSLCVICHVVEVNAGHAVFLNNIKVTGSHIDYPTSQLLTFIHVTVVFLLTVIV
jgi:hypothetical protein